MPDPSPDHTSRSHWLALRNGLLFILGAVALAGVALWGLLSLLFRIAKS